MIPIGKTKESFIDPGIRAGDFIVCDWWLTDNYLKGKNIRLEIVKVAAQISGIEHADYLSRPMPHIHHFENAKHTWYLIKRKTINYPKEKV